MKQKPKTFIKNVMPKHTQEKRSAPQVSPKINRLIAERSRFTFQLDTVFIVSFLSGMVLVGVLLSGYMLASDTKQLTMQQLARAEQTKELAYWENISATYPDYRDAYLKVGSLTYALGNTSMAQKSLEKAIAIDPNYMPARQLAGEFLGEK